MDMNIQVFVHYIKMAMSVWTTAPVFVEDAWNDKTHVCAIWGMLQLLRHRTSPMCTRNTFTNNVERRNPGRNWGHTRRLQERNQPKVITAEIQVYSEGRTQ